MAELTHLDEKLAEVLGLAQAAQAATKKVATLARKEKDTELLELMLQMSDDAAKIAQRCGVVAGSRDGMRTAITKKARETKAEVTGFTSPQVTPLPGRLRSARREESASVHSGRPVRAGH